VASSSENALLFKRKLTWKPAASTEQAEQVLLLIFLQSNLPKTLFGITGTPMSSKHARDDPSGGGMH